MKTQKSKVINITPILRSGFIEPPEQKTLVGANDYRKAPHAIHQLVKQWLTTKKSRRVMRVKRLENQDVRLKKLLAVLVLACTREGCYIAFQLSQIRYE